jgi:hypothetical protein
MAFTEVPGGLRTLATPAPGTRFVVRRVCTARARAVLRRLGLDTGNLLLCSEATAGGVVVETPRGQRLLVPLEDAAAVHVQWVGGGVGGGPRERRR